MEFFKFKVKFYLVLGFITAVVLFVAVCVQAVQKASEPDEPTVSDCKARLERDVDKLLNDPDYAGNKTRPKECAGVSNRTVELILDSVLEESLNK